MASYNAYSRVLLTKEIVDCIDQVLDNGNVASNLEKELREVKTNWENHDNSDTTNIPFDLLRTLHNKTRECSPENCPRYLHELLIGSEIVFPSLPKPARNPELEARILQLKAQQEEREYQKMVQNISPELRYNERLKFGTAVQSVNRQISILVNFVLTVLGAFTFAYFAAYVCSWDPVWCLISGLGAGTLVFYADLYFILRQPEYIEQLESKYN